MKYYVTANHVTPELRLDKGAVEVVNERNPDGVVMYYAAHQRFGCSRNYGTPHAAIRGLLALRGCTDVMIEGADIAAPVPPLAVDLDHYLIAEALALSASSYAERGCFDRAARCYHLAVEHGVKSNGQVSPNWLNEARGKALGFEIGRAQGNSFSSLT